MLYSRPQESESSESVLSKRMILRKKVMNQSKGDCKYNSVVGGENMKDMLVIVIFDGESCM